MPSSRSTKSKRASATNPIELRPLKPAPPSSASEPKEAPAAGPGEPTGSPTRAPGAVGPIGRSVLLIAALTLVGLVAVWLLLGL